jgi:hypothetical protein
MMGGANGSRQCAPDDKLRDTHQSQFAKVMGLNPSYDLERKAAAAATSVICPDGQFAHGRHA